MQSRRHSALESVVNVAVGYLVALGTQLIVFPALGIPVRLSQKITIGAIFAAVSLVRSYCLRRLFNRLHKRGGKTAGGEEEGGERKMIPSWYKHDDRIIRDSAHIARTLFVEAQKEKVQRLHRRAMQSLRVSILSRKCPAATTIWHACYETDCRKILDIEGCIAVLG